VYLGPFKLESIIGTGANGNVWLGRHQTTDMKVAIKVLKAELALKERSSEAFRREVHAVAALSHPHIITIFDTGEIPLSLQAESDGKLAAGSPYLIMEWASGGTLHQQPRPENWAQLRTLLLTLLEALGHAHANGVVHRDLKPANILFCTDEDLRPGIKLADFGLAMIAEPEVEVRRLLGTPHYMAPEQWRSAVRDQGPWTDMYALGCLTYRIMVGHGPFQATSIKKMRSHHLRSPVPELETPFPTPSGFPQWLRTLLAKNHHERFQLAADAVRALLAVDEIPSTELGPPRLARRDSPEIGGAGLGLYGLRSIPMVDRDEHRELLWKELKASQREVRVVVLEGPAGTGKSRLADWIAKAAYEQGMAAAQLKATHGTEMGTRDGLGPMIRREMRALGLGNDEVGLRDRAMIWLSGLGDVPPYEVEALVGLASQGVHGGVRFRSPRDRYATVTRIVQRLTRRGPVVIWLDDIHYGADTLAWVRHMLERVTEMPVLLVMTNIPGEGPESTQQRIHELLESFPDHCTTSRVEALKPEDRLELVQSLLSVENELAKKVARLTEGNPLFATQLIGDWVYRELLEAGETGFRFREDIDVQLPEDLEQVWATRLNHFLALRPEDDRRALEIAAVLGPEVHPEEWGAAAERAWAIPTPSLVEELIRMRLARTGERGPYEGWRFVHAMLRKALIESARRGGRLAMHNRVCSESLQQRGRPADAARIARMTAEGGRLTSSLAWLLRAFDYAMGIGDLQEAAIVLQSHEEAIQKLEIHEHDWRRIDAWIARARLAWSSGEDVLEHTERAVLAARAQGLKSRLCRALHLQGRVALEAGEMEQARSILEEAETLARDVEATGELAKILRDQAGLAIRHDDQEGALELLREARQHFVQADHLAGAATCSRAQSRLLAEDGRLSEAHGLLLYAIEQVEVGGDLRTSADLNAEAGDLAERNNNPDEALRHFGLALEQLRVVATDPRRIADIEARVNSLSESLEEST